jgi:hypothetical protein
MLLHYNWTLYTQVHYDIIQTDCHYSHQCNAQCSSIKGKVKKVECTLVQALRLCTGRTAQRGNRCTALAFLDYGTRRGWRVSVMLWPLFTPPPRKDPVPIVQEAGWAPRPVWTGAENLAPTGIWSPDCPARNQSLYRLSYPAHSSIKDCQVNIWFTIMIQSLWHSDDFISILNVMLLLQLHNFKVKSSMILSWEISFFTHTLSSNAAGPWGVSDNNQ